MLDFQKATEAIKHHEKILILPSSPVDGDSIGSALAVYSLLQSMGKNATVVLTSEIPDIYRFLPSIDAVQKTAKLYSDFMITIDLKDSGFKELKHEIVDNKVNIIVTPEHGTYTSEQILFPEPKKYFDLIVTVDCADLSQLGSFYSQNYKVFSDVPSINIDHHISNKNFASLNLVDTKASSTTQIIFNWFKSINVDIDEDIATLLLAGIITDTGSFQNANTTPESFDAAAELIDLGGRQQEIIRHIYKTKHLNSLKLWGKILSKIQVNETYRYLWSSATTLDFQQTGTTSADKGDIIDELLSNAQEADVILLLEEKSDGTLHGSLRSTNDAIDISSIATQFGGGGHAMAAGFSIPNATVDTHQTQILQVIEAFQKSRLESSSTTPLITSPTQTEDVIVSPSPIFQAESQPEELAKIDDQTEDNLTIQQDVSPEIQEIDESPAINQYDSTPEPLSPQTENSMEINSDIQLDVNSEINPQPNFEQSQDTQADEENQIESTEVMSADTDDLSQFGPLSPENQESESSEDEIEELSQNPVSYNFEESNTSQQNTELTSDLDAPAETSQYSDAESSTDIDFSLNDIPTVDEIIESPTDNQNQLNSTTDLLDNVVNPDETNFDLAGFQNEFQANVTDPNPANKDNEIEKLAREFVSKQDKNEDSDNENDDVEEFSNPNSNQ